jgi:hypothetical protein
VSSDLGAREVQQRLCSKQHEEREWTANAEKRGTQVLVSDLYVHVVRREDEFKQELLAHLTQQQA